MLSYAFAKGAPATAFEGPGTEAAPLRSCNWRRVSYDAANILMLLLLSGGFAAVFQDPSSPEGDSPVLRVIWAVVDCCVLFAMRRELGGVIRDFCDDRFLLLLLGLVLVSALWSQVPGTTLRRGCDLLGTMLVAVYLARRFTVPQQLRLLTVALGLGAALSALFAIALPAYGISTVEYAGAWRGIYVHKNTLGRMMELGAGVALPFGVFHTKNRCAQMVYLGTLGVIVLSRSATALIGWVIVTAIYLLFRAIQLRRQKWIVVAVGGALLAAAVLATVVSHGASASSFERDSTLTGRTPLWNYVVSMIERRPWLGYGYAGFWLGPEGDSFDLQTQVGWKAPQAHNGFLDLVLQLGFAGLCLMLASLGASLWRAWRLLVRYADTAAAWPMLLLVIFVISNLSENSFVGSRSIIFVLYVTTSLGVRRMLKVHQRCADAAIAPR